MEKGRTAERLVAGSPVVARLRSRWFDVPRLRWWYRIAAVAAVAPIVVAALRRGVAGWEPTWDEATTVVRIRDVFSAHPPLTGMAAFPSAGDTALYSFPGAMHLYLLAVPVRLLGTTWGVLLGMTAINAGLCLSAIWLMRRRVGEGRAIVGSLFVALLLWSYGTVIPVSPTPVLVGAVPMLAFLVAAWAVADGDGPAWVVFAFVGNYLFLNQLVFIVVVPVVALVAVGGYLVGIRRARRGDPAEWRSLRRRHFRWILAASALTVVLWIPPLIDQFVTGGHNLSTILHAFATGSVDHHQSERFRPTLGGALGVVTAVTAVPRGWLPPSLGYIPFDTDGGGTPFVVGMAWSLVVAGLLAVGVRSARRRGESTMSAAASIALAGWVGYLVTAWRNPDAYGYLVRYYVGLWSVGAFIWMVVAIGLAPVARRWLPRMPRFPQAATVVGVVAVLVASSLAVAFPTTPRKSLVVHESPHAAELRKVIADAHLGPGPVLVNARAVFRSLSPSVMLGLQDAGVPFRVSGAFDIEQLGAARSSTKDPRPTTEIDLVGTKSDRHEDRLLVILDLGEPTMPPAEYRKDDVRMRRWAHAVMAGGGGRAAAADRTLQLVVEKADGDVDQFLYLVIVYVQLEAASNPSSKSVIQVPGMDDADIGRWSKEFVRQRRSTMYVYARPLD